MRVFLVEDEPLLLMAASEMLTDLGHQVVGMATGLDSALKAARSDAFDLAVLDVNLGGDRIDPVAVVLADRGIPFVFTTGYGARTLAPAFGGRPCVCKPFELEELGEALQTAWSEGHRSSMCRHESG
jgi:CheY-like chemotaxis protein